MILSRRTFFALSALIALIVPPGAWGAQDPAGLGKVIYARREGSGVLYHTGNGDVHVSFPAPTIARIASAAADSSSTPGPVAASALDSPAEYEALDPRFGAIQSEALRVEVDRDAFSLRVMDIAGNLLIEDAGGGLASIGEPRAAWEARFEPQERLRGFGLASADQATSITIDFAAIPPPRRQQGLWLAPAPFGRVNDRCALVLRTAGQARLVFPEAGRLAFSTDGPFEAFVCLVASDEHYWQTLQFLLGRQTFMPRWLLGTGYTLDHLEAMGETRSLGMRLRNEGFPIDWMMLPAAHPATGGWNHPFASLTPSPALWSSPGPTFEILREDGVDAVFEVPSRFKSEAAMVDTLAVLSQAQEQPAPAASAEEFLILPIDYADAEQCTRLEAQLARLREQGFARWMMTEDERPADSTAQRPLLRAEAWEEGLRPSETPAANRLFVLDREARADLGRSMALLAPWRIDPARDRPSEAFALAAAAAEAGLPTWGLELPMNPEDYPSILSMRRWMQAALVAPYVLLRAPDWQSASPPAEPADLHLEARRLFAVRERLRPWMYSLARQAYLNGTPMTLSPGAELEPGSPAGMLSVGHDALFVAPDGEGSAAIPLPEGEWIDLDRGEVFQGGRTLRLTLRAAQILAFARRGAVIPFQGEIADSDTACLVARLYPSAKGQFALYEDAGEGMACDAGEVAITQIGWEYSAEQRALDVAIAGPLGDYAAHVSPRDLLVQVHLTELPRTIFLDGRPLQRTRFISGTSRILEPQAPLRFTSSMPPMGPAWDYDGNNLLYVWLPERQGTTRIRIHPGGAVSPARQLAF